MAFQPRFTIHLPILLQNELTGAASMKWLGFTKAGDPLGEVDADTREDAVAAFMRSEHSAFVDYVVEEAHYTPRQAELTEKLRGRYPELCHHEAAHAVIALSVSLMVSRISMTPRAFNTGNGYTSEPIGHSLAVTTIDPESRDPNPKADSQASLPMLLAGWAAERTYEKAAFDWERFWREGGSDASRGLLYARILYGGDLRDTDRWKTYLAGVTGFVEKAVGDHWVTIAAVAEALQVEPVMTGERLIQIIRTQAVGGPPYTDLIVRIDRLESDHRRRLEAKAAQA